MEKYSYEEELAFFEKWHYKLTYNTFWFDVEHVYEIYRNRNFEFEVRKIIFDEDLLNDISLKCDDIGGSTVRSGYPRYIEYYGDNHSFRILARIDCTKKLYYRLLNGEYTFNEITEISKDKVVTVLSISFGGDDIAYYYDTYGNEFASMPEIFEHLMYHSFDYETHLDDRGTRPKFYINKNTKIKIIKLSGPFNLSISYESELAEFVLSHKYNKDYDVYRMSKDEILLSFDNTIVAYNGYGIRLDNRPDSLIERFSKDSERVYLIAREFMLQTEECSKSEIESWDRCRLGGYDEMLMPAVCKEVEKLKVHPDWYYPIQEVKKKKKIKSGQIVRALNQNSDYIVPEQFFEQHNPTTTVLKETLARKRGIRTADIVCSVCHIKCKIGWEYKDILGRTIYLCSDCKAKNKDGKMNYHRMTISSNIK